MGPNFCFNVGSLLSRNKNSCNEERNQPQRNKSIRKKLSEIKKKKQMKGSPISNSLNGNSDSERKSGVEGNFILMDELRTQISTFRDLLDFSPCGGSLTLVQLLIYNLKDISRTYPQIKQCVSLSGLKHASVLQVYDSFCTALKSLGNHWANGDEWIEKSKNMSCNKYDQHGLEELVLATLKDINKLASERLFDMMDEDEQSMRDEVNSSPTSSSGNASLSHSSSFNKSCLGSSPATPTSVLPETTRHSYDNVTNISLLSPRLLPLRVQAVGKLNHIHVKSLSLHIFPHAIAQEPSYPIHQTSKSDSEFLNIDPQIIVEPLARGEANQCSHILMDSQNLEDTRLFPQGNNCTEYLTNRTTSVSKNGNQENMDQVSSPALSLSPSKIPPPPPPPPPTASTTINETSLLMPKAPPSLPEGDKNSTPHPPPPPPPMIKGGTPPPPPPVGNCVAGAPPPPAMGKGGPGAPPPPGLVGKNLLSNKAAGKLKRSAQMGNLYRMIKGKVEGSNANVIKAQGKGKICAPAGGKQGMADALAEITKKSAYFQQIEEDVVNHAQAIKEMKVAINGFQTSDMTELTKFHKHIESHLEKLADESQVLARFEDFPTKKLEALRMSANLYSKLDAIEETLESWQIISPVNEVLDKIGNYFDKIKTEIDALERTKDEEAKKLKAHKISFDFGILLRIKELMVDVSSGCMEQALKERREAKEKGSIENDSNEKGSGKVLWKAFQFAYRVYTFAGGHDDRADMLTKVLAQEIQTDPHPHPQE